MPIDPASFMSGAGALLKFLCRAPSPDLPICKTRIVHGGSGMIWNKRVGIHPRENDVHVFPIEAPSDNPEDIKAIRDFLMPPNS